MERNKGGKANVEVEGIGKMRKRWKRRMIEKKYRKRKNRKNKKSKRIAKGWEGEKQIKRKDTQATLQ